MYTTKQYQLIDSSLFNVTTDGSVKEDRGGGGVVMIESEGNQITSRVPADRNKRIYSFYAEANAMLEGLLLIETSKTCDNINSTMWMDSKLCLQRAQEIYNIPNLHK